MSIVNESWPSIGPPSIDGATSEHGHNQPQNTSIASSVVFHAKTSPTPDTAKDWQVNDLDCGMSSQESFAKWDQDTLSWRTYQLSLLGGLIQFSGRWPRSGTMRNGIVFRHQPLVPRISAIESGSWVTPAASDGTRGGTITAAMTGKSLAQQVNTPAYWPTPTVHGNNNVKGMTKNSGDGLATAVKRWPTPTARDFRSGMSQEALQRRIEERGQGVNLSEYVQRTDGNNGKLNPQWVEWLMGFPPGWTELEDSATRLSRSSPNGSDAAS
jgi:hypothetical protein